MARSVLIGFTSKETERIMSEESTEEIKVDSPRKPLEPVGGGVSDEQWSIYAQLLAEFERIRLFVHDCGWISAA